MLIILILIAGIISGIFAYRYSASFNFVNAKWLTDEYFSRQNDELTRSSNEELLWEAMNTLKTYLLLWLSGVLGVGIVAAPLFTLIKGFIVGFTCAHMIYGYGLKGLFFDLLLFSPYIFFYFPALLFSGVCIFSFHIRNKNDLGLHKADTPHLLTSYSILIFFAFIYSLLGILFDRFIIDSLLSLIAPSML